MHINSAAGGGIAGPAIRVAFAARWGAVDLVMRHDDDLLGEEVPFVILTKAIRQPLMLGFSQNQYLLP